MNKKNKVLPYIPDAIQNIIIQYCYFPPKYADELREKTSRLFNFLNSWYPTSRHDCIGFFNKKDEFRSVIDFSYIGKFFVIINTGKFWRIEDIDFELTYSKEKMDLIDILFDRKISQNFIYKIKSRNAIYNRCYLYY